MVLEEDFLLVEVVQTFEVVFVKAFFQLFEDLREVVLSVDVFVEVELDQLHPRLLLSLQQLVEKVVAVEVEGVAEAVLLQYLEQRTLQNDSFELVELNPEGKVLYLALQQLPELVLQLFLVCLELNFVVEEEVPRVSLVLIEQAEKPILVLNFVHQAGPGGFAGDLVGLDEALDFCPESQSRVSFFLFQNLVSLLLFLRPQFSNQFFEGSF